MMSTGDESELLDDFGSTRTCNPKSFSMTGVEGIAGGFSGCFLLDHSLGNFSGYINLINHGIKRLELAYHFNRYPTK